MQAQLHSNGNIMQAADIFHFCVTELANTQHFTRDAALDVPTREWLMPILEAVARQSMACKTRQHIWTFRQMALTQIIFNMNTPHG